MAESQPTVNSQSPTQSKRNKDDPITYPPPLIITPLTTHMQTIIFLHGRGSTGQKLGPPFLESCTGTGKTLPELFPGMKFIFPTAAKRRARWYNRGRAMVSQWFDCVPVNDQDEGMSREEEQWQVEGLRETAAVLWRIVEEEKAVVGARNVFVGGLSQGCAMALHLLLSCQGLGVNEALGGFVGMSGWLPFARDIEEIICPEKDGDGEKDDLFAYSDDEDDVECGPQSNAESIPTQICNLVRDNMDLSPKEIPEPIFLDTPVFLGHGVHDEKVKVGLGLQAAKILGDLGMKITWKEYDEGHWYKVPHEIDDIVEFLVEIIGR